MKSNNYKLGSGLFACGIGFAVVAYSWRYPMGTLRSMGPGLYPLVLGLIVLILGAVIIISPESEDELLREQNRKSFKDIGHAHGRPWIAITLGTLAFIAGGVYGGLICATFFGVAITAAGDRTNRPLEIVSLAALSTIFAIIVFGYLLKIQMPLLKWS